MPVESHPLYSEWRAALEKLVATDDERKMGAASDTDVAIAAAEFGNLADKIDA